MKLRIRDNSIRLRLGRGEVRRLLDEGRVAAVTRFAPSQQFEYEIEQAADAPDVVATFDGKRLLVRVPSRVVRHWAAGEEVAISAGQPTGAGGCGMLSILIEKDFECLDAPAAEAQEDAFPNPRRRC